MYSTCLFCARPLGHNEAIEHFPVGRRLAFDPDKGRLWVVCGKCERWNLSPLETRWDAIEEAERAYRKTPVRVSTDNVGLARLSEGLELVRIGEPPRPELAAWRYGDQFGRRRRRHTLLIGAGAVATVAMGLPAALPTVGLMVGGAALTIIIKGGAMYKVWTDSSRITTIVRGDDGAMVPLTERDIRCATFVPQSESGADDWTLRLPYWHPDPQTLARDALIRGDAARHALGALLPHLNSGGGNLRQVREATDLAGAAPSLDRLLSDAAHAATRYRTRGDERHIGSLAAPIRLALEMALHEGDERRAMEGELHLLEARWRDAEEIAAIADALTLPAGVEERFTTLRQRAREGV